MLIDDRTIGESEHLGLALEAANNTQFLGTPSAGADSALTNLQRQEGLQSGSGPGRLSRERRTNSTHGAATVVSPCSENHAIRAGRDVVLEKAIEYLLPQAIQARV